MRPNNRQRSRGGRNSGGGGGGGGHHHKPQHHNNPNRPPNRNQIFDSSGPDVRVRGNAHQVFDKYQALAREAAASGDRILSEAYWQYADHYFRVIQTVGGFGQRNNVGWGDGGEDGQSAPQQPGQGGPSPQQNGNGHAPGERLDNRDDQHQRDDQQHQRNDQQFQRDDQQPQRDDQQLQRDDQQPQRDDQQARRDDQQPRRDEQQPRRDEQQPRRDDRRHQRNTRPHQAAPDLEPEPGLGGVAFLQNGRSTPPVDEPETDDQPDVPEFTPAKGGRRG